MSVWVHADSLLTTTLAHLRALVSFDTRNPPRSIGTDGIFDYLRAHLHGFDCAVTDHGAGAVSLFATRGKPRFLINVHLDTVPDSAQWSASPFALRVTEDRAIGLGACDIKGAAAALLTVAAHSAADAAFLFTSDEEANDARCISAFLNKNMPFEAVIVAEPTGAQAVLAHRGISSVAVEFRGCAGHASSDNAMSDSAVHHAIRWGSNALDFVAGQAHQRFGGLTGLRFNIGQVSGGIKANVIAPSANVRFGFRPLPCMDFDALLDSFRQCASAPLAEFSETFRGPSLPSGGIQAAESQRLLARDLADAMGLTIGNAVDFWTEAALFSAAGYTTFVLGPGDIEQAHSADEWVALSDLQKIIQSYRGVLEYAG